MELNIVNTFIEKRNIIVEFENDDKILSLSIPKTEFREWIYLNSATEPDARLRDFVDEYIDGVINIDSTSNLLLAEIFNRLMNIESWSINFDKQEREEVKFVCDGFNIIISRSKRSREYTLWFEYADGYKEIKSNVEVIRLYRTVLMTTKIIHTILN